MAWIKTVDPSAASGRLAQQYEAAARRAGRVFQIIRTMSVAPPILESSFGLYQRVMFAREGLTRRQRELLAVVVSRTNDCHY